MGLACWDTEHLAIGITKAFLLPAWSGNRDTMDILRASGAGGWGLGLRKDPSQPEHDFSWS